MQKTQSQQFLNQEQRKTVSHFRPKVNYIHAKSRPDIQLPKFQLKNNLNEIINASNTGFDPFYQSRYMIHKQLIEEERNDIDFYKIQEIDKSRAKKRNNTNFRSIHYITDKPLAASINLQLYQYKDVNSQRPQQLDKMTPFQIQSRQELKKQSQDKKLLLKEIYQKLDEEGVTKNDKKKVIENLEKQDCDQVDDLDIWSQKNTAFLKKKQNRELPNTYKNSIQNSKPINKVRNSILGMLSRKGSIQIANQENPTGGGFKNLLNLKNSSRKTSQALPSINNIHHNSSLDTNQSKQKENSKVSEIQNSFVQALLNAEKLMKSRTDKLGEIKEADRDIKKKLNSYINAEPNGECDNLNDIQVDLSADKIVQSLYQRLTLETQQESMRKLVKFYEKQTTIFQTKLHQNIREIEVYMANKTNTIRLLRTENHTHIQRIRKLDDQIEQLQKELKAGPKKPANNNLGLSTMNMSSNQSITSPLRGSKIGSDQENRSMLIDKIMVQKNFENSKKDAIQNAKQQKIDLMEKINNNSEQIYIQEEQLGEKKKKFKDLERAQKLFYFELLKIGKDTRNKGLVWIILYLKKQGEKVKLEQLPDFLDQKAREFIFQKTQKIMELQEMVSIQEMQIDVYKQSLRNQINVQAQNQSIQSPQKTFFNSKNDWTSILDQQASILLDAAMANPSYNNNNQNNQNNNTISFNNNNNNIQNHQSSIINTMIEQANQVEQQNFSIINVSQVKQSQIHQAKLNQVQDYRSMISTLSNREKEVVDETLNQLFYPKTTSSDVFYDETKKKMRQTFRIQKQVQVPQPTNLQEEDEFSDYSDSMEQVQDLVENLQETKGEQMQHNIVLYDNDQQMNNYETKEEFFQAHRKLNVKIQNKKKEIKTLDDQELSRIVKEFDYKNYLQKYHTKYSTVLCALFGVTRAEREIVKNGLKEK